MSELSPEERVLARKSVSLAVAKIRSGEWALAPGIWRQAEVELKAQGGAAHKATLGTLRAQLSALDRGVRRQEELTGAMLLGARILGPRGEIREDLRERATARAASRVVDHVRKGVRVHQGLEDPPKDDVTRFLEDQVKKARRRGGG